MWKTLGDPIDPTVGGLVWVRRNNGSWWPGQIVEPAEGSENLGSPSATPIKLLGRDDVSVDWYNLEKTNRVKPFRCGEYAACIRKAKVAATKPARKAVKYARREDAIICALEIERQTSGNSVETSHTIPLSNKESEHMDEKISGYNGNSSSVQDLIEDSNHVLSSPLEQSMQARLRRTPNDSEDDGTEGVKRMRGLDDLGMGMAPAMKRKRTQVGHVHELKRKDRRRPLSKVLQSTSMVSVPGVFKKLPCSSEFESNEPNQSSYVVIDNSDSMGVPYENGTLSNTSGHASESFLASCKQKEKELSSLSIPEKGSSETLDNAPWLPKRTQHADTTSCQKPLAEALSSGNEELYESVSTSSGSAEIEKWQSKGKRNSRNTVRIKKTKISNDDEDFNENLDEYWGWSRSSTRVNSQRQLPFRQSRSIMNPKYGPEFTMTNQDDNQDDNQEDDDSVKLQDVNLEVKASSRPPHVPYISLSSKLTGQSIVGHPLTVEIVEEDSTDDLIRGAKHNPSSSSSEMNVPVSKHLKSHRVSPVRSTTLRRNTPSPKKIRKLSSITGFSGGERILKAEKIMGPTVACVPLRVVFSRINAAVRGLTRPPRNVMQLRNR